MSYEYIILEKKDGIAGVVVYVRHEKNDSRLIKRGKDIVLEITPRVTEVQPSPGDAADSSLAVRWGVMGKAAPSHTLKISGHRSGMLGSSLTT